MKKLQIEKAGSLELDSELTLFESENGIKLPDSYREFLLTQNPYTVKEDLYQKDGRNYEIHHFYPFDSEIQLSVQFIFDNLNAVFEGKYFAFADDSGGWQYVVSIQEVDCGKVYFCRMDEALEDALTPLADTFEQFVNGLEIEE